MNKIHCWFAVLALLLGFCGCATFSKHNNRTGASLTPTPDQALWQSWDRKVALCFQRIQFAEAGEANDQALAVALEKQGSESLEYARSLRWKGILESENKKWGPAKATFERCRTVLQKQSPENPELSAEVCLWNACVSEKLGNIREAESLRQQAMRLWDATIVKRPALEQAHYFYSLAETHRIDGMFLVTEALYRRAGLEYERVFKALTEPDAQDPHTFLQWAMAYGNLAWIDHRLRRLEQAIAHYEQALRFFQRSSRPDHWKVPEIEMRLSAVRRMLEQ